MRVKTSVPSKNRHKKLLSRAKGYRGTRKSLIKMARQAVLKAGVYSYRDRRNKKRLLRSRFIMTINSALKAAGLKYNVFIDKLHKANIEIDRKILASLASGEPAVFQSIVDKLK